MNSEKKSNKKEKSGPIFADRDVLGLQKPQAGGTPSKSHPNRIFIGLAIAIIIGLIYWLIS